MRLLVMLVLLLSFWTLAAYAQTCSPVKGPTVSMNGNLPTFNGTNSCIIQDAGISLNGIFTPLSILDSAADYCTKISDVWTTQAGVNATAEGTGTIACSGGGNIFAGNANGTVWLPSATFTVKMPQQASGSLAGGGTKLVGTGRLNNGTIFQAVSPFPAGTTSPSAVLMYGDDTTTQGAYGQQAQDINIDCNGQPGVSGIYGDTLQEESKFTNIHVTGCQVEGIGLGHGNLRFQHFGPGDNIEIGAGLSGQACTGTSVTITAVNVSSTNTTDASTGNATITVASAVPVYVNQVIYLPSSLTLATSNITLPAGTSLRVTSGGTSMTTFTVSLPTGASGTTGNNTGLSASAQIWGVPLSLWNSTSHGGLPIRGWRNTTINYDSCSSAPQPPLLAVLDAPGEYSGIHNEGGIVGIRLGVFRPASDITISQSDLECGSTAPATNFVQTGVLIDNIWGQPTNVRLHNISGTGCGNPTHNPTYTINDVANSNLITYANNPQVTEYIIDGSGTAWATLANCADMTNGWCRSGGAYTFYSAGNATLTLNGSSSTLTSTNVTLNGTAPQLTLSGTTPFLNNQALNLMATNLCRFSSAISIGTTATTICQWTLPGTAKQWAWSCSLGYTDSTGTTSFGINMQASQMPTRMDAHASIGTNNVGTVAQGSVSNSTSTSSVPIASATPTGIGTYQATAAGTIQASATSGTFKIQGIAGALNRITVNPDTWCQIF